MNIDERIRALYQFFLLDCDWQDSSNHLQMSTTASLLLNHFLFSFVFIFAGAPIIESTHNEIKFTAPLTAITAAVVSDAIRNIRLKLKWVITIK